MTTHLIEVPPSTKTGRNDSRISDDEAPGIQDRRRVIRDRRREGNRPRRHRQDHHRAGGTAVLHPGDFRRRGRSQPAGPRLLGIGRPGRRPPVRPADTGKPAAHVTAASAQPGGNRGGASASQPYPNPERCKSTAETPVVAVPAISEPAQSRPGDRRGESD